MYTGHVGNMGTTAGTGTEFHTGTGHFGNFGTTSIPVPDTLVTSVRHPYRHRTEHTLGRFHLLLGKLPPTIIYVHLVSFKSTFSGSPDVRYS